MTSILRSPNEMMGEAKRRMLDHREPKTRLDWYLVVNFWAANIAQGLEESACLLMHKLYDNPLSEWEIRQIAQYQAQRKEKDHV